MEKIQVFKTTEPAIRPFRELFLYEHHAQFVHNKCHLYGWADTYCFTYDGNTVGYGAVWGSKDRKDRDAIFEFYLLPGCRKFAGDFFTEFRKVSAATAIECQTNDSLLHSMIQQYAKDIVAEAILFEDHFKTELDLPGARFSQLETKPGDRVDELKYNLAKDGQVLATGGLMLNYNHPFADIYMEVKEGCRRLGLGSFFVQEIKKACYLSGKIPVARCNTSNKASQATLTKAGMKICGFILNGKLRK